MSICVLGEALIDFLEQPDGQFSAHLGGSPFNVAIGLGRLSAPVHYLSPISTDRMGESLYRALRAQGVSLPDNARSPRPTSLALVVLDDAGQPSYRLYREGVADTDITFDTLIKGIPADIGVLHTGSLALAPATRPVVEKLMHAMREHGVLISVDVNVRTGVCEDTEDYLDGVRRLLPLCHLVKGSDEDLAHLYPNMAPLATAGRVLNAMNDGLVLLTRGAKGAVLLTQDLGFSQAVDRAESVVDTVGAGDTFQAAFLASTYEEATRGGSFSGVPAKQLAEALRRAGAAAAINVSRAGCNPPDRNELDTFLTMSVS